MTSFQFFNELKDQFSRFSQEKGKRYKEIESIPSLVCRIQNFGNKTLKCLKMQNAFSEFQ